MPDASHEHGSEPDLQRRMFLTGLSAACLSSFVPSAAAQATAEVALGAFLAVSKTLTGQSSLDSAQAARLYAALVADAPGFPADVQALLAWIEQRNIDPRQLQRTLDAEKSVLAALPRKIVTAWYTGIVGEGERARCITFETSLMYAVVADHLKAPSYCHGPPGSWAEKPV